MFGPSDWPFGPETGPCVAPVPLHVPDGWYVSWEQSDQVYKLKAYPLGDGDMTFGYLDRDSLDYAQSFLDDLIDQAR